MKDRRDGNVSVPVFDVHQGVHEFRTCEEDVVPSEEISAKQAVLNDAHGGAVGLWRDEGFLDGHELFEFDPGIQALWDVPERKDHKRIEERNTERRWKRYG